MNYCPNCGTEMHGRFCSNCGFDSQKEKKPNFFTRVKEWFQKAWAWIKGNKKLSILIGSSAVAVLTLVIVFSSLSNVFRVGKVNNIELGMSKEEVTDILGDPTETLDDDSTYCWYEKKAAKKIEKINGSFDDMLDMDEDISEEDFEDAFEEADGEYSELEEMTFKAIIVEFSSNKVTRVVFDKNHKYDEFDEYATAEEKVVKKMEMGIEEDISVITIERETGTETQGNIQPFEYTATFEDGSYVLGTANPKIETNDQTAAELKWSDMFATYSTSNKLTVTTSNFTIGENGVLTAWNGTATNVVIPEEITSIKAGAFSSYHLISVTIPESVTSIEESAFSDCPKLVEIYNKSAATVTIRYGVRPNVYSPASGESKLTTDKDGYIIYTDGEDKILMGYVGTKTNLKLPKEITDIYDYAFYGNNTIEKVTIPSKVSWLSDKTFEQCVNLRTIKWHGFDAFLIFFEYQDYPTPNTKFISTLFLGIVIILSFLLVVLPLALFVRNLIKHYAMNSLYYHIYKNPNVEITTEDGETHSVASYLQEKKETFEAYVDDCRKRKKKWKITTLIIAIPTILAYLFLIFMFIMEFIVEMSVPAPDAPLLLLLIYTFMILGPLGLIFCGLAYRSSKKRAKNKFYKQHLQALEQYYPEKIKREGKEKIKISNVLNLAGLQFTEKELKLIQ